jgi:transcriptional regulator with XRE-family HTH domain
MTHPGHAIRATREPLEWSIRELARRADVNPGYLSRFERGQVDPTPRWLFAVETALAEGLAERGIPA